MAFGGGDAVLLEGCFLLAGFDGGDTAFYRAHAVEVFIELLLVGFRQCFAQIASAAQHSVEHLPIERIGLGDAAFLAAFAEEPVQNIARIGLGRHRLGGRAVAAVIIITLMQAFLIFLPSLRHGGQLQRRQQGMGTNVVGHDLIGRNGDIDAATRIGVGQSTSEPGGQLQRMRRAIEWIDRHTGNALHHQALVHYRFQRSDNRRRRVQERLLILRPKLIHDHPVRHVHERHTHRWLGGVLVGGQRQRIHKRQSQRNARALEKGATVNVRWVLHFHPLILRCVNR